MNRLGRAGLMVTISITIGRLLWSGGFGWFVQQRMRIPLIIATGVLLIFGAYEAVAGDRAGRRDPATLRHPAGPAVGWLLILPVAVLASVAPTGLGASAADRVDAFTPSELSSSFPPLAPAGEPIDMTVYEFLDRALWDDSRSLEEVPVRLEGLVVNDPELTDGFLLTRFMVSCCAADGIPLQVAVHGADRLADDTWVVADLLWSPPETPYQESPKPWVVEADAVTITAVPDAPYDPYESPY